MKEGRKEEGKGFRNRDCRKLKNKREKWRRNLSYMLPFQTNFSLSVSLCHKMSYMFWYCLYALNTFFNQRTHNWLAPIMNLIGSCLIFNCRHIIFSKIQAHISVCTQEALPVVLMLYTLNDIRVLHSASKYQNLKISLAECEFKFNVA